MKVGLNTKALEGSSLRAEMFVVYVWVDSTVDLTVSSLNSYVEALTSNVTVSGNRIFRK